MTNAQDERTAEEQAAPVLPAFPGREEDILFKAQMSVANAFYGYWKHAIALLGLVLLAVFVWGSWQNHVRDTQRGIQAKVAEVTRTLQTGLEKNADKPEMIKAQAAEGARRLVAVGDASQGPGATYAYIRAARAWDIAEDQQQELATWEKAYARHSSDELGWAAVSGLAAARFDSGDVDGAVTVLVEWAGQRGSYDAQRSLFDAARYQELAGQTEQALASYQALLDRFPQSMLADQTAAAIGRLQSNG